MSISETISEELELEEVFDFEVPFLDKIYDGLGHIVIDEATVVSWIIMGVILIIAFLLTRNLKVEGKLSKRQLLLEMCVEKMRTFFKGVMGEQCDRYLPWLMSVAVYIGASNMIGLIGFKPPTKSLWVTGTLAIMTIILVQIASLRARKIKGYFKSFTLPVGIVTPINVLELVIKPLSLCMRLFGNILGAFIIMEILKGITVGDLFGGFPILQTGVSLLFSFYFDLFDGFLQAYIFVFLSALYLEEATELETLEEAHLAKIAAQKQKQLKKEQKMQKKLAKKAG